MPAAAACLEQLRLAPRGSRGCACAALLALTLSGLSAVAEAKRVALVVGNDRYQNVTALRNARSDAAAVAEVLKRTGFEVTLKQDLTLRAMKEALRSFKAQVSGGDEAVFYFSGHGVQFEGTNYLIPTDLAPQNQEQVVDESVPLQRVLDDLRDQKARFVLAIVDACRDNPFKGTGRAIGGRGLAPVTAANGQMILYSAGAGQEALDRLGPGDSDPNGVFTRVLIKEILRPGVPADQVLKNVRDQVVNLAHGVSHEQVPALYDQSVGAFYFVPPRPEPVPVPVPDGGKRDKLTAFAQLAAARTEQQRQKIEQDLWELLRQSLPANVPYGVLESKEGGVKRVRAFQAASAVSDGRTATVTVSAGDLKDGHFTYDDRDIWHNRVDCARHEFIPLQHLSSGSIEYLSEARRKATSWVVSPDAGDKVLEQVLCELPIHITPLWAVRELEWTDLGAGWKAALKVRWADPRRPNERYVFARISALAKPNWDGSDTDLWWLAANCKTGETRDTMSFTANGSDEPVGILPGTAWTHPKAGSPAANAYVLLCEQP